MKLNSIKHIFKLLSVPAAIFTFSGCNENKFVVYDTPFVCFDAPSSSSTSIDAAGTFVGSYYVHYSGKSLTAALTVDFSVTPGDGLTEGVDYEMVTNGTQLTFMPGIFDIPIRIRWLSANINSSLDTTLKLRLESANQNVVLGYPGPSENSREIIIRKY